MAILRADFVKFIRGQRYILPRGVVIIIDEFDLPDNGIDIDNALSWALSIVPDAVKVYDAMTASSLYPLAVYQLAMHYLILYSSLAAFDPLKQAWGLCSITIGITSSASDGGTSTSVENPEFLKKMPLSAWQQYQTPNGRAYLGIVSDFNVLQALM